jgi:nucleoside-diphosphate-sugar epimerase
MYTIVGGNGFIGRHFAHHCQRLNLPYFIPPRNDSWFKSPKKLGHVIYCAGLTSDYRSRLFDTVEAHVALLNRFFQEATFESFLYLSSTRVYQNLHSGSEDSPILINSCNKGDVYNLSKLLGESICFNQNVSNIRVVRLSNVCGNDFESSNFLYDIAKEAYSKATITLQDTPSSEKDYITVDDVIKVCWELIHHGKHSLYNVASGINLQHKAFLEIIQKHIPCQIHVVSKAVDKLFPVISITRIAEELGFSPESVLDHYERVLIKFLNGKIHDPYRS